MYETGENIERMTKEELIKFKQILTKVDQALAQAGRS